jgi:uncharacterized alpha-E superfamily protein
MRKTVVPGDDAASAMGVLLRKITGFSGLVHENMYRFSGWRFLTIGRSLERAIAMADLLAEPLRSGRGRMAVSNSASRLVTAL